MDRWYLGIGTLGIYGRGSQMWTSGFVLKLQATEGARTMIDPLFEARILSFDMCHVDRLFMGSIDFWAKTLSLRAPRPHQKRN